jgi:hypothetical protein
MHLIFHGIIKQLCQIMLHWTTDRRCGKSFQRYYKGLLDPISDLSLDWCKLPHFHGSFSGWLAENYVGLSKITPWFWSGLSLVAPDPEYQPPVTPYTQWNGALCKEWLKARDISILNMNAAQAREEVKQLIERLGGPPAIPPPTGGPVKVVLDMFLALDRLTRVLMAGVFPVGGKDVITLHVLDFLNSFAVFKPISDERKIPQWLSMYNFPCLLNLAEAVDLLGPLRFNYEGSSGEEGFIPMVKPLLSQGLRSNWQKNLGHRFFRVRAMKLVLRDAKVFVSLDGNTQPEEQVQFKKKMFHPYSSWQEVENKFNLGHAMSLVVLRDGLVGAVVADRASWLVVPVTLHHHSSTVCGLHYFHTKLFERDPLGTITGPFLNIGPEAPFVAFVLLIPRLEENNYQEGRECVWTMVGSEYERLSPAGVLQTAYDLPITLQTEAFLGTAGSDHQPPDATLDDLFTSWA